MIRRQLYRLGVAVVPFLKLLEAPGEVADPRRAEGKRYRLPHLLLFTVPALLTGARSYRGVITFMKQRRLPSNAHFGSAWKSAPSVNTLRTLLRNLDGDELEDAFRRHAKGLLPEEQGEGMLVVALDGKTLKKSFDHMNDRKAAQVLGAFASEAAVVPAHADIDDKSNEIPAARRMIGELGLEGVLFTVDAMNCQKNIRGGETDRQLPSRPGQGQPAELAGNVGGHRRYLPAH